MTRTVSLMLVLAALWATPVFADCVLTSDGKGRVCSGQSNVTGSAASVRELAAPRVRTSVTLKALSTNSAVVRCGPMPVTVTTGLELAANQSFTWDQILPPGIVGPNAVFFGDIDIGCISTSGTQVVNRSENYK